MVRGSVSQQFGRIATERGRANEKRALDACVLPARPAWMQSVRMASREEDRDGIDLVIDSDVGKLYVQVKSSRGGKMAFLQRRRRARVAVVVVSATDSPEAIQRRIVGEVGKIRAEFIKQRGS